MLWVPWAHRMESHVGISVPLWNLCWDGGTPRRSWHGKNCSRVPLLVGYIVRHDIFLASCQRSRVSEELAASAPSTCCDGKCDLMLGMSREEDLDRWREGKCTVSWLRPPWRENWCLRVLGVWPTLWNCRHCQPSIDCSSTSVHPCSTSHRHLYLLVVSTCIARLLWLWYARMLENLAASDGTCTGHFGKQKKLFRLLNTVYPSCHAPVYTWLWEVIFLVCRRVGSSLPIHIPSGEGGPLVVIKTMGGTRTQREGHPPLGGRSPRPGPTRRLKSWVSRAEVRVRPPRLKPLTGRQQAPEALQVMQLRKKSPRSGDWVNFTDSSTVARGASMPRTNATYRVNVEANDKAYDLNQKSVLAVDALANEYVDWGHHGLMPHMSKRPVVHCMSRPWKWPKNSSVPWKNEVVGRNDLDSSSDVLMYNMFTSIWVQANEPPAKEPSPPWLDHPNFPTKLPVLDSCDGLLWCFCLCSSSTPPHRIAEILGEQSCVVLWRVDMRTIPSSFLLCWYLCFPLRSCVADVGLDLPMETILDSSGQHIPEGLPRRMATCWWWFHKWPWWKLY